MPALQVSEDDLFVSGVDAQRLVFSIVSRETRAFADFDRRGRYGQRIAEALAVGFEVGVKGEAVERFDLAGVGCWARVVSELRRSMQSSGLALGWLMSEYKAPDCSPMKSRLLPGQRTMSSGFSNLASGKARTDL
jgi:hypothetical protein